MNLYNSCQHFYTAYEHGKPVGVCLRIIHDNCAGIYAVATLPEFRKKGISTAVMSHALKEARKTGIDTITLKVATDSYAHLFYRKLGFIDVFKCSVHDSITG
ncbi:MAG: GNAT family N-acetyltransferase [Ignavibacteria bacterium]|nr:GNAT family N-acetyltransferase [Ignavibacteria bacterium]